MCVFIEKYFVRPKRRLRAQTPDGRLLQEETADQRPTEHKHTNTHSVREPYQEQTQWNPAKMPLDFQKDNSVLFLPTAASQYWAHQLLYDLYYLFVVLSTKPILCCTPGSDYSYVFPGGHIGRTGDRVALYSCCGSAERQVRLQVEPRPNVACS